MTATTAQTAALAACIVSTWWAAKMMLRSSIMATLAVVPLAAGPVYSVMQGTPHTLWSEAHYTAAAMAVGYALWLKGHLAGRGTSIPLALAVGFLFGLAASARQESLGATAAFMAYLALYSRGRQRLLMPLVIGGLAVAAYVAANPLTLVDLNAGPWDVGPGTILRRFGSFIHALDSQGPAAICGIITRSFFFWPMLPTAGLAVWACRRERWFPVAGCFGGFLTAATALELLEMRLADERYMDPVKLGFYFFVTVCIYSAAARAAGYMARGAAPSPDGDGTGTVRAASGGGLVRRWKALGLAASLSLLVVMVATLAVQAEKSETIALDEALWFMRSHVLPSDISTDERRMWAVDVPGVNRWVYWTVLSTTGLDKVPPDEPCPWSIREGVTYWNGVEVNERIMAFYGDVRTFDKWMAYVGKYAPRKAILAMRAANLAAFTVYIVLVWLCARTILGSRALACATIAPIVLSPAATIPYGIAFYVWSGDVFMMVFMAAALLVWLRYHARGAGVSAKAVINVALLLGMAVASKQHAFFALWGFMAYLAWESRGWRRLANPLLAVLAAAAIYILVNPVMILYPGAWPWDVQFMVAERRVEIVARYMYAFGPAPVMQLMSDDFYWWPILPTVCVAAWGCRRERWFAPVFFMGSFLVFFTMAGLLQTRMTQIRYMAPLQFGLYFTAAVCVATSGLRAAAALRASPAGASPPDGR